MHRTVWLSSQNKLFKEEIGFSVRKNPILLRIRPAILRKCDGFNYLLHHRRGLPAPVRVRVSPAWTVRAELNWPASRRRARSHSSVWESSIAMPGCDGWWWRRSTQVTSFKAHLFLNSRPARCLRLLTSLFLRAQKAAALSST